MLAAQGKFLTQLNQFYNDRVAGRRSGVTKTIREVCKVIQDVLREVEVQEPRFISSLTEINGHYEGLQVNCWKNSNSNSNKLNASFNV